MSAENGRAMTLEQRFAEEMRALAASGQEICLLLDATEAWAILGQLQLALRHPANVGPSSEFARKVAHDIQRSFATDGALLEVAERGWHMACDEPEQTRVRQLEETLRQVRELINRPEGKCYAHATDLIDAVMKAAS